MAPGEDLDTRITRLRADPRTIEKITVYVSGGGTLQSLCEVWDVPFGAIASWINLDTKRKQLYADAVLMREMNHRDQVIEALIQVGMSDIREIFNQDGSLKPFGDMPKAMARTIASVEVDELFEGKGRDAVQIGFTKKIKFWDKNKALEMLGKHYAMFKEVKYNSEELTLEQLLALTNNDPKLIK